MSEEDEGVGTRVLFRVISGRRCELFAACGPVGKGMGDELDRGFSTKPDSELSKQIIRATPRELTFRHLELAFVVFCKVPNTKAKSKNRSTPRDFANQTWHLSRWIRQTNFFSANEFLVPCAVFFFPAILFSRAPICSPSPPPVLRYRSPVQSFSAEDGDMETYPAAWLSICAEADEGGWP
jgi:hypothetical protein